MGLSSFHSMIISGTRRYALLAAWPTDSSSTVVAYPRMHFLAYRVVSPNFTSAVTSSLLWSIDLVHPNSLSLIDGLLPTETTIFMICPSGHSPRSSDWAELTILSVAPILKTCSPLAPGWYPCSKPSRLASLLERMVEGSPLGLSSGNRIWTLKPK